jgi:hypothetical protein
MQSSYTRASDRRTNQIRAAFDIDQESAPDDVFVQGSGPPGRSIMTIIVGVLPGGPHKAEAFAGYLRAVAP